MNVSNEDKLFDTLRGKAVDAFGTKEVGHKALLVGRQGHLVRFESFLFSRCWVLPGFCALLGSTYIIQGVTAWRMLR